MPYWRAYYHLVWATRAREPLISTDLEEPIQRVIRAEAHDSKALIHAVGFMPDHVHVVASIPPSVAISTFVGKMKGGSSHLVNNLDSRSSDAPFKWQSEFGMVTFGEKALQTVVDYALNQFDRHTNGQIWPTLERFEGSEPNR
jgi:putative transposase